MTNLIYNHYLIIDRQKKKLPLQLGDKEKEWMDINTDGEDNITIGYDHIPWRILQVIVTYLMKP